MSLELRGTLDPAPVKRISTAVEVEPTLVDVTHRVHIDEFEVAITLQTLASANFSVEGAAIGGLIVVSTVVPTRDHIDSGASAMMTAALRMSDALRAAKPSIGLVGQPPEFVSFAVRDLPDGRWGSYNHWPPSRPWYIYPTATEETVVRALQRDLTLVERLLAQATYWAAHAAGNDPYTAVLLAAIACESHAKSVFAESLAARGEQALSALLLARSDLVAPRAADLYSEVALSIVGKSLKVDDRSAYNRLQKLFELRNKVAHTGSFGVRSPRADPNSEALQAVVSARRAVAWLLNVVAAQASSSGSSVPE